VTTTRLIPSTGVIASCNSISLSAELKRVKGGGWERQPTEFLSISLFLSLSV
jgi:hypothetical protein